MVDIRVLKTIVLSAALAIALALAFAFPAAAGFADGQEAFNRGAYSEAADIWRPLAEGGDIWAQHSLGYLYEKAGASSRAWRRRATGTVRQPNAATPTQWSTSVRST